MKKHLNKKTIIIAIAIFFTITAITIISIHASNENKRKQEQARQQQILEDVSIEQKTETLEYGEVYKLEDLFTIADTEVDIKFTYENTEIEELKFLEIKNIELQANLVYLESSKTQNFNFEIVDTVKPEFTGESTYTIQEGDSLDLKTLITASDKIDGTLEVSFEGSVDTNVAGEYKVIAKAIDVNNNESTMEITVTVNAKPVVNSGSSNNSSSSGSQGNSGSSGNSQGSSGDNDVINPQRILVLTENAPANTLTLLRIRYRDDDVSPEMYEWGYNGSEARVIDNQGKSNTLYYFEVGESFPPEIIEEMLRTTKQLISNKTYYD